MFYHAKFFTCCVAGRCQGRCSMHWSPFGVLACACVYDDHYDGKPRRSWTLSHARSFLINIKSAYLHVRGLPGAFTMRKCKITCRTMMTWFQLAIVTCKLNLNHGWLTDSNSGPLAASAFLQYAGLFLYFYMCIDAHICDIYICTCRNASHIRMGSVYR